MPHLLTRPVLLLALYERPRQPYVEILGIEIFACVVPPFEFMRFGILVQEGYLVFSPCLIVGHVVNANPVILLPVERLHVECSGCTSSPEELIDGMVGPWLNRLVRVVAEAV